VVVVDEKDNANGLELTVVDVDRLDPKALPFRFGELLGRDETIFKFHDYHPRKIIP